MGDYEDRQFQKVVTEGLVPKVEGSAMFVSICPGVDKIDAKFCVEMGVAIMLDKPILAIVDPEVGLEGTSKKLQMVADEIVIADIRTDEGRQRIAQAIKDFTHDDDSSS